MGANPVIYAIHIWKICSYLDLNMRRLIDVLKGFKKKQNTKISVLPARLTNQNASFTSSCSLVELADIQ